MLAENGIAIRSITEATLVARRAKKDDLIIPIEPCVRVDSAKQVIICPYLDPKLTKLCTDPDGVTPDPDSGVLQCPRQKGSLVLINNHS